MISRNSSRFVFFFRQLYSMSLIFSVSYPAPPSSLFYHIFYHSGGLNQRFLKLNRAANRFLPGEYPPQYYEPHPAHDGRPAGKRAVQRGGSHLSGPSAGERQSGLHGTGDYHAHCFHPHGLRADGDDAVILGAAVTIALDPMLIFVLHMGVRGAA